MDTNDFSPEEIEVMLGEARALADRQETPDVPMAVPEEPPFTREEEIQEIFDEADRLASEAEEVTTSYAPTISEYVAPPAPTPVTFEIEELEPFGDTLPVEEEGTRPQIPVNSKSLLIDESTSRFSSAVWYEAVREKTIILAGVGGIGSYVAFLLGRMKPRRLIIYDNDKVETVNMSGQLFSKGSVGLYKTEAIINMIHDYADFYNANGYARRFTEDDAGAPIMICGFDNMAARKIYFESWLGVVNTMGSPENALFIDGRLAAEEFQVFAIQGNDQRAIDLYRNEWLFSDEEAEETLCSYKQTTYMANMIGSVIVNLFTNFVANQCDIIFPKDVPFMTSYDAGTMRFKVEM